MENLKLNKAVMDNSKVAMDRATTSSPVTEWLSSKADMVLAITSTLDMVAVDQAITTTLVARKFDNSNFFGDSLSEVVNCLNMTSFFYSNRRPSMMMNRGGRGGNGFGMNPFSMFGGR